MIAVIGGIKVKIEIKMKLPEAPKQDNWLEQMEEEDGKKQESYDAIRDRMLAEREKIWQGEGSNKPQSPFGNADRLTDGTGDEIHVRYSGCAYNVARHLAARGNEVKLISILGKDPLGMAAEAKLTGEGVDISGVKAVTGQTPLILELKNFAGEIEFARVNESLFDSMTPEFVMEMDSVLSTADAIVIDGSLPRETIHCITRTYGKNTKIFYDPASRLGGSKVNGNDDAGVEIMDSLFCIMPGRAEAEKMTDMIILGPDQLMMAGDFFTDKGIGNVFVTMKGGGVYYKDAGNLSGVVRPERILHFAETAGAGDWVSAVIVDQMLRNKGIESTAVAAMDAAAEFLADLSDERPY